VTLSREENSEQEKGSGREKDESTGDGQLHRKGGRVEKEDERGNRKYYLQLSEQ